MIMTAEEEDAILCNAIIAEVNKCRNGVITTTELVDKVEEIIDCGKALETQRKRKENQKL